MGYEVIDLTSAYGVATIIAVEKRLDRPEAGNWPVLAARGRARVGWIRKRKRFGKRCQNLKGMLDKIAIASAF